MRSSSVSWRLGLIIPAILFVASSAAQPPPKGKQSPPAKGKEEVDPKAALPKEVIRLEDEPKGEPPAPAPEMGVLVVAVRELPNLMSPAFARTDPEKWALDLIFEGLLRRAADMSAGQHYEPALARELPQIKPLSRTFLMGSARWAGTNEADSRPVTAEDVRGSWDRLHARAGQPGAEVGEQISAVIAQGQDCRLVLRRGQLDPLALATFKVLPRPEDEAFARHPVGSGPFIYDGQVFPGGRNYAVFKPNPTYGLRAGHANQPHLKEVRLLASRDPVADFKRKSVHLALSPITGDVAKIHNARPEEKDQPFARLEAMVGNGQSLQTQPSRRIYYLAVNHQVPTLGGESGKLVRRVLANAIRRDAILTDCYRAGFSSYHQPLNGPFPPGTWPCSPLVVKGALDNPEGAQGIRDTTEYKNALGADSRGKPREFELKYPEGDPAIEKACQMIAKQVEDVKANFTIKPVAVPPEKLWKQIEHDTDFKLAFRHYDYPDDWFSLAGLLDPSVPAGAGSRNFMAFKPSEVFEPVFRRCQDRRDFGKLREAMHKMHEEFVEELPFIPLWHLDTHVLISQQLETRPAAGQLDPLRPFVHIDEWRFK